MVAFAQYSVIKVRRHHGTTTSRPFTAIEKNAFGIDERSYDGCSVVSSNRSDSYRFQFQSEIKCPFALRMFSTKPNENATHVHNIKFLGFC